MLERGGRHRAREARGGGHYAGEREEVSALEISCLPFLFF